MHRRCHACDIDLVEVRNGKIVAFTDFKMQGYDTVTWVEERVYEQLGQIAPVFVVYSMDADLQAFEVYSYPDNTLIFECEDRKTFFREFIEKL